VSKGRIILASLLAGAGTLIVELIVARSMGAYFGTSLYVWTSVLGITMMSLSIGYILGGRWIDRSADSKLVFRLLMAGGAAMIVLPWISPIVMTILLPIGLQAGSLVSALVLLGAPLISFGALTPAVIRLGAQDVEQSGRVSGVVYAVSTLGGVIASLMTSLMLVPHLGIRATSILVGVVLVAITAIFLRDRHL
jgi:predicted membrane-bound spermidine synthase